jgi:hypothetical protein
MSRPSIPPKSRPERPNKVQDFLSTTRGEIMIVIHTSSPPSDAEWKEYMDGLASTDLQTMRSIVITDGGAPNSAQRKAINDLLHGRQVPGIVISPSPFVRGVVTALAWFNPGLKAYSPDNFDDACRYLELTPDEIEVVWDTIDRLRDQLDDPSLRAIPVRKV